MKNLSGILFCLGVLIATYAVMPARSDKWIWKRVVQLEGNGIFCTGEQIRAPSGVDYILSAGHCMKMSENGSVNVTTEDGKHLSRRVIAEDMTSDLMLIEGLPNLQGFDVGTYVYKQEKVRAITHGGAKPTYETRGELLGVDSVNIPMKAIQEDAECSGSKYKILTIEELGLKLCILSVEETVTTAKIIPGSSGGPIINEDAELVGVASATDGNFGTLVKLSDIRLFIAGY